MFTTVTATEGEVAAGALDDERAALAADALWRDGAVVLADVVARSHVDALRAAMEADIAEIVSRGKLNGPPGHYSQGPPIAAPHVFKDVVANPLAVQVASRAVEAKLQLTLFTANTILPCSEPQQLHRDQGNLWKSGDESHRPSNISVHVPLVDIGDRNGATEVWPGTHRLAHAGPVPTDPAELDARAASAPPSQLTCPAGGIILRDARAWHRGMPNLTDEPRVMIGMIYAAIWARQGSTPFHHSAEPELRDAALDLNPTWVGNEFDHLSDWRDPRRLERSAAS